jgi:hypothetical protein
MLKFFKNPFAITGTRAPIPAADPGTGEMNYPTGFTPQYQLPKTDPLSRNIPRDQTNQLYFDLTNELKLLQEHGVPDFITAALNEGVAKEYSVGDRVRYDDGVNGFRVYVSRVNANTDLPTVAASWTPARDGGLPVAVVAGTANALTATFSPTLGLVPTGTAFLLRHAAANTGPATLAVNGGAAKAIVRLNDIALGANDIPGAGSWGLYVYDLTLDKYVLLIVQAFASTAEAQAAASTNRSVTPANLAATVLGIGQTWQTVTGSRALGVTYTNTTGRPILVSVQVASNVAFVSGRITFLIDGVLRALQGPNSGTSGGDSVANVIIVIPAGSTYSASATTANLSTWHELRT